MSKYGGCIVCGVTLGKGEVLRCSDCQNNGSMENTGAKAEFIRLTDSGPVEVDLDTIFIEHYVYMNTYDCEFGDHYDISCRCGKSWPDSYSTDVWSDHIKEIIRSA